MAPWLLPIKTQMPPASVTPTVIWELRKGEMRLVCSVRRISEGFELEQSINGGEPFLRMSAPTEEKLNALAEGVRQQDIEDGWSD